MTRVKEFCTSQFAIPLSQSIVKIKNRVATLKNILSQKYYLNYENNRITKKITLSTIIRWSGESKKFTSPNESEKKKNQSFSTRRHTLATKKLWSEEEGGK